MFISYTQKETNQIIYNEIKKRQCFSMMKVCHWIL